MPGRLLGVVLAGGRSSRFGSDKALAQLGGRRLIDLAVDALSAWCAEVVIVGRSEGPARCLPDWPQADMGPLGGLAAALHHARDQGFDAVLSCGVDSPGLPTDLPMRLGIAPAFLADQPVIGIWPVRGIAAIEAILTGNGRHSMRALAEALGARAVSLTSLPGNINRPDDLAALEKGG